MAVGEARKNGTISQVSWTDGTAQDVYYGQEHSFQYSANINCDDEMHGIKLASKMHFTSNGAKSQLIACGDLGVIALPLATGSVKKLEWDSSWDVDTVSRPSPTKKSNFDIVPGVIFQDNIWYGVTASGNVGLVYGNITGTDAHSILVPYDHPEATDEDISNKDTASENMANPITAILNYNNTRLVVASGQDIWVYYPELDVTTDPLDRGKTGWKKVMTFEAGVTIVALTCTFEYLKIRAVDEGWNTKIYFYQGNDDLRNTFVYNIIDLTGQKVCRVYPTNGTDYYITSIDGTDGYVNLYKMVGTTPVLLLKQRGGLTRYDINTKAPYFVGPCSINSGYAFGSLYIADAYGVFKFNYTPNGYDKGYMKWKLHETAQTQVYGLCINKNILYVSTDDGVYATRVFDTGKDGYQSDGILISREYEGQYGGTITKMLDEIRLNFELNPLTTHNGTIDVYVSPNNLWESTDPTDDGWYHVMHISQTSAGTRTEKSNLLNNLDSGDSAFKFDWQTITYAIKITLGTEDEATPIVRQIDINYHTKDKINNVYNIN